MTIDETSGYRAVKDPSAWKASDFPSDSGWLYELSDEDRKEIEEAVRSVKRNGPGFFLLRGIPIENHDLETIKLMYWGIGVHLGVPVFQNTKGHLMTHVEDRGDEYGDVNTRLYTTAAAANPHNDPSDVVGLLCVRKSPSGGASMIASATAIYNEILDSDPHYIELLHRGFPHDLRGEGSTHSFNETTPNLPIYSHFGGNLSCCISSKSSRTARDKQGRPLSNDESDTLKLVERLFDDPRFFITMNFQPGDAQFLNNYVILHSRTALRNGSAPGASVS